MSNGVFNASVTLIAGGTLAVGTVNKFAFKAPTDDFGGGITVVDACVCSASAIGAGTAPLYTLVTLGTNSAINGTIGTWTEGAFTAGTVKNATITAANAWVDGGFMVAFREAGTVLNPVQLYVNGYVQYKMGR